MKTPKFGTKNALFGYFKRLLLYLTSWNQQPGIYLIAKVREKIEFSKFGTKNILLGYFLIGIWKQYCHIWNQHLRYCFIAKLFEKMKMPKFWTKNALFAYVRARILKNYCHIWNQHPRTFQIAKFCEKMKMPKFGPKMPYSGILGLEFVGIMLCRNHTSACMGWPLRDCFRFIIDYKYMVL